MAWVQQKWPPNGPIADGYGLYGIERLGILGNLRVIGGHSWYRELAPALAAKVLKENGVGDNADCAFRLLFLTRGTSSAYAQPVSAYTPAK
jgi:hypothetical protein